MPGPIDRQIWSLVIVGNGSSAAYYMATVDLNLYPSVLAIGQGDPWNGPRGHVEADTRDPTRFINHPLHLIAHFRKTIPGFSNALVDRLDWAKMNADVLSECNVRVHNAKVRSVEEAVYPRRLTPENIDPPPSGFRITLEYGTQIYAHKVVMATGTGGHRMPDHTVGCTGCAEAKKLAPLHVIDLDEFAWLGPQDLDTNTKVMVLGANAAIDAIQKSVHYKCKLYWLIDNKTDIKKLPILDSQPSVRTKVNSDPDMFVYYDRINVRAAGSEISVEVTPKGKPNETQRYLVDYFVYGVGPTGSTTSMIASGIQEKLKPIFDKNQAVSKGEAILGFEAEGTGLLKGFEVIGALAGSVGRDWSKNQVKNKETLKKKIDDLRSERYFWIRMKLSDLPEDCLLQMDPDELVSKKRDTLYRDLCNEKNQFLHECRHAPKHNILTNYVEMLVNLLISYYAAHYYRDLMNLAAKTQSQGMVADAGQLMAINAGMAGKHATVPAYLGKQTIDTSDKDAQGWVKVTQESGEVNFNQDNPTMLFIGLTVRYPAIPHKKLSSWIENLMRDREKSGMGFDEGRISQYYMNLNIMDTMAVHGLLRPDEDEDEDEDD